MSLPQCEYALERLNFPLSDYDLAAIGGKAAEAAGGDADAMAVDDEGQAGPAAQPAALAAPQNAPAEAAPAAAGGSGGAQAVQVQVARPVQAGVPGRPLPGAGAERQQQQGQQGQKRHRDRGEEEEEQPGDDEMQQQQGPQPPQQPMGVKVPKPEGMKKGSSKYTGSCWSERRQQWMVNCMVWGKQHFVGWFGNEEQAARAYDRALLFHGGRVSCCFPYHFVIFAFGCCQLFFTYSISLCTHVARMC